MIPMLLGDAPLFVALALRLLMPLLRIFLLSSLKENPSSADWIAYPFVGL